MPCKANAAIRAIHLHIVAALTVGLITSCDTAGNTGADEVLGWGIIDRIPLEDPDQSMSPSPWGIVADAARGRIYVADGPNHRVLAFSATEGFISQFGREGSGPGEFRNPWALSIGPDGNISVLDTGLNQISRWTPDGTWIESSPIPPGYWGPEIADLGDRMIMVTTQPTTDASVIKQDLTQFAGDGLRILGSVVQQQATVSLPCLQSPMPVPKPIARRPIWTVKSDTVLAVLGVEYAIDYYVNGERVKSLERNVPPVEVTEERVVDRIAEGELRIFIDRCGIDAQTVANSMDWKETVAPVEHLAVAPDGRVWATRPGGTLSNASVDIFEPDGEYRGTVPAIPQPISFLSPNTYVGFAEDQFGVSLQLVRVATE